MKLKKMIITIKKKTDDVMENSEKFIDDKNQAAGTRARKDLQEIALLCKEARKKVIEVRNKRKKKNKK